MAKRIAILGSTGSIGTSTIDVVRSLKKEFKVVGLGAGRRWKELAEQAKLVRPATVVIADPANADKIRPLLNNSTELLVGPEGLVELAGRKDSSFIVAAIVGAAGLESTVAAVRAGKQVGLANKEALVVAGSMIVPLSRKTGAQLLPIDSEHSAIFQSMQAGRTSEVCKIYLTASGGPFRTWTAKQMAKATLEDALRHPTWSMGPKITIDSATMMNKALEIIEAKGLFDVDVDSIEVVVHPESIIHSMVEFCDGSVIAQLGTPDMRTPIQYALTHPQRCVGCASRLDFSTVRRLNFEEPDFDRFPALRLGYEVARTGGSAGAVFNAANETAIKAFQAGSITFGRIVGLIEEVLGRHKVDPKPDLDALLEADRWARQEVAKCLKS
ncbi:MAG: 1-deoxy-D-xylulose-5-phosphate reductoisomerase [Planctomycetota bacterium]|nr:MAG: 1-deoxy-D-xylulose-5-phosphate reductoisomerase [Planctomycetota bacterium]